MQKFGMRSVTGCEQNKKTKQKQTKTSKSFKKTSGGDLVQYINMKKDRFWGFRMTESLFKIHGDQIHVVFMSNSMF